MAAQDGALQELPLPVAAAVAAATPVPQAFTSADLPLVEASYAFHQAEEDDDVMSELSMPEDSYVSHGLTLHGYDWRASSAEQRKAAKTCKLYELLLPTVKKAGKCT